MAEEKSRTEEALQTLGALTQVEPSTGLPYGVLIRAAVASGLFKDDLDQAKALMKILAGRELGLGPFAALQTIYVARGSIGYRANAIAARIKASKNYDYKVKTATDEECTLIFYERNGEQWDEVGVSTFTMTDAKRARLVKEGSGYETHPGAMLFARAVSKGYKMYCPHLFGGLAVYTEEELEEIERSEQRRDVTAEGRRVDETPPDPRLVEFGDYFAKLEWSRGKSEMFLARFANASGDQVEQALKEALAQKAAPPEAPAAPAAPKETEPASSETPPMATAKPAPAKETTSPTQRLMEF